VGGGAARAGGSVISDFTDESSGVVAMGLSNLTATSEFTDVHMSDVVSSSSNGVYVANFSRPGSGGSDDADMQ